MTHIYSLIAEGGKDSLPICCQSHFVSSNVDNLLTEGEAKQTKREWARYKILRECNWNLKLLS